MKNKFDSYDLASFFNGLVFFAPVALLIRTQAGVSESVFFILQALLSVVIFFGEIPTGFISDRIGHKKSLILSQILLLCARILLTLAFLRKSIVLFVIEVFVEGISTCLLSGTDSAYLYETYGEENFLNKTTRATNFGTAGFIISTLAYVLIYRFLGMEGLLYMTILMGFFAVVCRIFLKDVPQKIKEDIEQNQRSSMKILFVIFKSKRTFLYVGILSVFSVVWIMINFFYIENLQNCGIKVEWMSAIILIYSAIQMLAEPIITKLQGKNRTKVFVIFCIIGGLGLMALGVVEIAFVILSLMVSIPLIISIPEYFIMEEQNKYIDDMEQEDNRATTLSAMNMGVNIIEIIVLFGSALLTRAGTGWCFGIAGFLIIVFAIIYNIKTE